MTVKFANFFKSSIADVGGISSGDLEVTLGAGDGANLPTLTGGHHCYLTLVDSSANREVVKVTGVASDTCTIERGEDGTTPRAFAQGDLVELRLTKGSLEDIQGDISVLEDIIEAISNGEVGTDDPGDFEVDVLGTYPVVTSGFNDGTQNISFPTNGMAAAKFMVGDSDTILWMYLNTAPPGWKVLATGADTVLGVAGGSQAYNVNGGNSGGTWTQPNHTHTGPSHSHLTADRALTTAQIPSHSHTLEIVTQGAGETHSNLGTTVGSVYPNGNFTSGLIGNTGSGSAHNHGYTNASGTGATGGSATASTYRPAASVGRLFQLDTA